MTNVAQTKWERGMTYIRTTECGTMQRVGSGRPAEGPDRVENIKMLKLIEEQRGYCLI